MRFVFSARGSRALTRVLLASATISCATAAHAAVTISDKPTSNMSCTGGVCSPTAAKANLNVTDLASLLAAGDATVATATLTKDIRFQAPLSWTSTSRLTLVAHRAIAFEQPITVAGIGAITISTTNAKVGGDYWFEKKGHIEFWDVKSSLMINGKNYVLVGSISDLSAKLLKKPRGNYAFAKSYDASPDGTYSQIPIQTNLEGVVDGLGNGIKNLSIQLQGGGSAGLFGVVDASGVVQNLQLVRAKVRAPQPGSNRSVGALAAINYGRLRADSVSGEISGSKDTNSYEHDGGLVGTDYGPIVRCHSTARVTNATFSGGLAGSLEDLGYGAEIVNSSATGIVSSYGDAGGLVATILGGNATVVDSMATGNVDTLSAPTYIDSEAGGIAGYSSGKINGSYAAATTMGGGGGTSMGGLVGVNDGSLVNSYAAGSISSVVCGECGGLVGTNDSGTVSAVYSTVQVDASTGLVGGLIGKDAASGNLANTYWNLDTSGISDPSQGAGNITNDPGITGLTDPQLKAGLPDGFDPKIWGQSPSINNGYPYLLANPPPKK